MTIAVLAAYNHFLTHANVILRVINTNNLLTVLWQLNGNRFFLNSRQEDNESLNASWLIDDKN